MISESATRRFAINTSLTLFLPIFSILDALCQQRRVGPRNSVSNEMLS
jgi:hypothetical protein